METNNLINQIQFFQKTLDEKEREEYTVKDWFSMCLHCITLPCTFSKNFMEFAKNIASLETKVASLNKTVDELDNEFDTSIQQEKIDSIIQECKASFKLTEQISKSPLYRLLNEK